MSYVSFIFRIRQEKLYSYIQLPSHDGTGITGFAVPPATGSTSLIVNETPKKCISNIRAPMGRAIDFAVGVIRMYWPRSQKKKPSEMTFGEYAEYVKGQKSPV